jgi:hypothetical protein
LRLLGVVGDDLAENRQVSPQVACRHRSAVP